MAHNLNYQQSSAPPYQQRFSQVIRHPPSAYPTQPFARPQSGYTQQTIQQQHAPPYHYNPPPPQYVPPPSGYSLQPLQPIVRGRTPQLPSHVRRPLPTPRARPESMPPPLIQAPAPSRPVVLTSNTMPASDVASPTSASSHSRRPLPTPTTSRSGSLELSPSPVKGVLAGGVGTGSPTKFVPLWKRNLNQPSQPPTSISMERRSTVSGIPTTPTKSTISYNVGGPTGPPGRRPLPTSLKKVPETTQAASVPTSPAPTYTDTNYTHASNSPVRGQTTDYTNITHNNTTSKNIPIPVPTRARTFHTRTPASFSIAVPTSFPPSMVSTPSCSEADDDEYHFTEAYGGFEGAGEGGRHEQQEETKREASPQYGIRDLPERARGLISARRGGSMDVQSTVPTQQSNANLGGVGGRRPGRSSTLPHPPVRSQPQISQPPVNHTRSQSQSSQSPVHAAQTQHQGQQRTPSYGLSQNRQPQGQERAPSQNQGQQAQEQLPEIETKQSRTLRLASMTLQEQTQPLSPSRQQGGGGSPTKSRPSSPTKPQGNGQWPVNIPPLPRTPGMTQQGFSSGFPSQVSPGGFSPSTSFTHGTTPKISFSSAGNASPNTTMHESNSESDRNRQREHHLVNLDDAPPPSIRVSPSPSPSPSQGATKQQFGSRHTTTYSTPAITTTTVHGNTTTNNTRRLPPAPAPPSELACGGCSGPIIGRIVSAMGARWHPGCFRCCVCCELLECVSSYESEGKPYCHLDYHELFAPRCYHCKTAIIDERFITLDDEALGKRTYHEQHFFCAECGDPFLAPSIPSTANGNARGDLTLTGDGTFSLSDDTDDVGFTVYKGHPYCEACHVRLRMPKCVRCRRSIREGTRAVEALGGKWCWGCFLCAGCNQPFEDPSFFLRENKPFCEPCFSVMLRNDV